LDAILVIFRHPDQTADMILSEEWNEERFSVLVDQLLRIAIGFTVVYVSTMAVCFTKRSTGTK